MMRSLLATAAASLLSGCAAVAYGDGAPVVDRPFQTDAALGERTLATSTSGSYIYVSNQNGPLPPRVGSILVYPAGSNGDVAPSTAIAGSNTRLTQVDGIAVTSTGEIYAADSDTNMIVGFPAGSNGNVTPNVTIAGSNTGLASPLALAVDQKDNLYVANCGTCNYGPPGGTSVEEFAPGSNGNAPPVRVIAGKRTQMGTIEGIAVDRRRSIYVSNSFQASVTVYAPRAKGNAAPRRVIAGPHSRVDVPVGIAVSNGHLFVTAADSGYIERFPSSATGDAAPHAVFRVNWRANPSGQFLAGIASATDGSVYVAGFSAPLVAQYSASARGRARPLAEISGPNTQLVLPTFVYVK